MPCSVKIIDKFLHGQQSIYFYFFILRVEVRSIASTDSKLLGQLTCVTRTTGAATTLLQCVFETGTFLSWMD